MLTDLTSHYQEAKSVWEAQFDRNCALASTSAEWDAYEAAGDAIVAYPCQTIEEVRLKSAFILENPNLFDTVQNCFRLADGREIAGLTSFLHSLLGKPVDKQNSGDN